jgi:hypothetical protein
MPNPAPSLGKRPGALGVDRSTTSRPLCLDARLIRQKPRVEHLIEREGRLELDNLRRQTALRNRLLATVRIAFGKDLTSIRT